MASDPKEPPYFPNRGAPLELELLEARAFDRSIYQCWGRPRAAD